MAERYMQMPRQASRTRQKLLLIAANNFDRKGFLSTNLQEICTEAGVTKGALYCHFRSKEALAAALIESQLQLWYEVRGRLEQRSSSPLQILIDLSHEFGNRLRTDVRARVGVRLLFEADLFDLEAGCQFLGWVNMVRDLLGRAVAQGQARADLNIRDAADGLVGAFTGAQLLSRATSGYADITGRFVGLWRLWLPVLVVTSRRGEFRIDPPSAEQPHPELAEAVVSSAG